MDIGCRSPLWNEVSQGGQDKCLYLLKVISSTGATVLIYPRLLNFWKALYKGSLPVPSTWEHPNLHKIIPMKKDECMSTD